MELSCTLESERSALHTHTTQINMYNNYMKLFYVYDVHCARSTHHAYPHNVYCIDALTETVSVCDNSTFHLISCEEAKAFTKTELKNKFEIGEK